MSIMGSPVSSTLVQTADKAEYVVHITRLSHTYIRLTTLLARLITRHSNHNGRLHVFIFKGDDGGRTTVLGMYDFQRSHKTHITVPSPTRDTHDYARI